MIVLYIVRLFDLAACLGGGERGEITDLHAGGTSMECIAT